MALEFSLEIPPDFSFRHTVGSHGWSDLPPFETDEASRYLVIVAAGTSAVIRESDGELLVRAASPKADVDKLSAAVRHILRLDEDLSPFYRLVRRQKGFSWVARVNAGRLLRSPTVFEDLIKSLCTTNCSWGLTKSMVNNLVEKLGEPVADGKRAFPTASAMAEMPEKFYREEMRAGYRSPYLVELAAAVAEGKIDPEAWTSSELPTVELKKEILSVKGVGNYAAENLLKLLGRYGGLALDSWLRAGFYEKHNSGERCEDASIEHHYERFGDWKGLAIWCDMTRSWFDERA